MIILTTVRASTRIHGCGLNAAFRSLGNYSRDGKHIFRDILLSGANVSFFSSRVSLRESSADKKRTARKQVSERRNNYRHGPECGSNSVGGVKRIGTRKKPVVLSLSLPRRVVNYARKTERAINRDSARRIFSAAGFCRALERFNIRSCKDNTVNSPRFHDRPTIRWQLIPAGVNFHSSTYLICRRSRLLEPSSTSPPPVLHQFSTSQRFTDETSVEEGPRRVSQRAGDQLGPTSS